jgi:NADH-quinone oxidoreductase subunit M
MTNLDQLLLVSAIGLLLAVVVGPKRLSGWLQIGLYAVQLVLLVRILSDLGGPEASAASAFALSVLGNTLHWEMTGVGWFFAVITVGAALFAAWYASGEWGDGEPRMRLFYGALASNVLAMLIFLASGDLLSLFIGWELVSWASYLIMTQRGGAAASFAFRYLMYAMAGAMAILGGLVFAQTQFGSLEMETVRLGLAAASNATVWAFMGLLGAGFAIKMGLMPFHLWQAEAYGESPGPAAAFLGAISSRMGLFALLILLIQLIGIGRMVEMSIPLTVLDARDLWAWIAAFTAIVPTFIALTQNDARMLLAWHGIGQGGYMLLGIMVATPMGVAGGLMHVFNHASYQAPLFLAVAAVVHRTGTADLDRLGGLINRMPLSYLAMLLGIIGLAGIPPMNGFVSKWLIYKSLLDAHHPLLFIAAVIGTLGTILSVYKLIHNIFLGQLRVEHSTVQEVPLSMSVPMLLVALLAFITGFMPGLALEAVAVAQQALGLTPLEFSLGGVTTGNGSLDMLWVVGPMLIAFGIGALIFLLGNRSFRTHQLDNYAGGHFLTANTQYHYSHHFYAGLLRVIEPWLRDGATRAERGLTTLVTTLGSASFSLYRGAYTPLFIVIALVVGLLFSVKL